MVSRRFHTPKFHVRLVAPPPIQDLLAVGNSALIRVTVVRIHLLEPWEVSVVGGTVVCGTARVNSNFTPPTIPGSSNSRTQPFEG